MLCGQAASPTPRHGGKPDIEAVDLTSRMTTINDIFEVTTKPLIFDADTGGRPSIFLYSKDP